MYIPNYDKYKDKNFWIGFAKVATPIILATIFLLAMLNTIQPN